MEEVALKVREMAERAGVAARSLRTLSTGVKDSALLAMARSLEEGEKELLEANARDLCAARDKGLSSAMLDRLTLNPKRVGEMAGAIRDVAALRDPVGEVVRMWRRPNGLQIGKVRVPIGVVGIIYESRPNVTADAAALCLKSGNAVILRGGSEALESNLAIARRLERAAGEAGVPRDAIQLIPFTEREAVRVLLGLEGLVDLVVPRGGESLIRTVVELSRVPVIKHDKGLCHTYVDKVADLSMAERIVMNAKTQRPGVCNAMETLLVHEAVAASFLPVVGEELIKAGVELRGCPRTRELLPEALLATEEDWATEYLDLILSVKVVGSLEEAMDHIARYGSGLSEAIVTGDYLTARHFLDEVDAGAVYVNASTRFTDGGQFGLGAELGISTNKLHARGPMGLEELTSYKYIVYGEGQVRE